MKLIFIAYLFLGIMTGAKIAGRGLWSEERLMTVVIGNCLLWGLFVIGLIVAVRNRSFLGFDKWLWMICTIGAYAAGMIWNLN